MLHVKDASKSFENHLDVGSRVEDQRGEITFGIHGQDRSEVKLDGRDHSRIKAEDQDHMIIRSRYKVKTNKEDRFFSDLPLQNIISIRFRDRFARLIEIELDKSNRNNRFEETIRLEDNNNRIKKEKKEIILL